MGTKLNTLAVLIVFQTRRGNVTRYKIVRDKQQENNRKKNHRISKKLRNINEVVNNLKEKESSSAAEYMEVY